MSAPSIFIVGAEGSGTTLVWKCVVRHPELSRLKAQPHPSAAEPLPINNVILHLSLPTLRPMRWVGGWAVPRGVKVIVVRRSPLHTVFSAYRRFYEKPRPAWRNYFRAVDLEASWTARHEPLCVAYEELVHNSAAVLRRMYDFLGIDADFVPPIAITNQNDERWCQDQRFTSFMRSAFGINREELRPAHDDVPAVTLVLRCHGTRIAIADASGAGLGAALRAVLPPNLEPADDGTPDVQYTIERMTAKAGSTAYRIVSRGEVHLRTRAKDRVVGWLRAKIEEIIAESSRMSLFVHAGVVGWRGHAIVVPGRSMTGKSRLITELVRCGATYYSDEFAVFDDEGRVLPYARQTVLRDPGIDVDLGSRDAVAPLPVALIVSTSYRAGASWQPRAVRGVRAVTPIIDNTVLAREETRRLLQLAAKIAPRVVTLQGPRPEAVDVAPQLLAYLDDLLAEPRAPERGAGPAAVVDRAQTVLDSVPPDHIEPPRYVRVDALLEKDEHARLLAYILSREADFAASGVIDPAGVYKVDDQFRRSATLYDLKDIWDLFATRLRRLLPQVRQELGLPWFPLGRIERQMAVHRQGDFFGRHHDNGKADVAGRRVTCVYYFHSQPKRFSGGNLKIHERVTRGERIEAGPGHVVVEPADNTAVFFPSNSPHEVCPIEGSPKFAASRFSITVWFWLGTTPACLEGNRLELASP